MPSTLTLIKNALVTATQTIAGVGATGTKLRAWYEENNHPAVYVAFGSEVKAPGPTRSKEGTAEFILPTVVRGDDPLQAFLDFYEKLEEAVEADPSLGGLAQDCYVAGSNALVTSETIAGSVHVADVFVRVLYRHGRAAV